MKNIVVFASGSGSNFQSIIEAIESGTLNARLVGLVSNKSGAGAIEKAESKGIPTFVLRESDFAKYKQYELELLRILNSLETDCIVLAGYLRKIPEEVINSFENRILNIHPSLLPKYGGKGFYGLKVHTAVIDAGDKESGCSIHIVTKEYDDGPVIAQAVVKVEPDDTPETLASRVLKEEHKLYPPTINQHLKNLK